MGGAGESSGTPRTSSTPLFRFNVSDSEYNHVQTCVASVLPSVKQFDTRLDTAVTALVNEGLLFKIRHGGELVNCPRYVPHCLNMVSGRY